MEPIAPEALLGQLERTVARLAAPAEEQWSWVEEHRFPVSELKMSLDDQWPLFQVRLSETMMIDSQDEKLLDELKHHVESIRDTEDRRIFTREGLRGAQEWETARRLAGATLESLKRPFSQKHIAQS